LGDDQVCRRPLSAPQADLVGAAIGAQHPFPRLGAVAIDLVILAAE
jgi:hypothetical protein